MMIRVLCIAIAVLGSLGARVWAQAPLFTLSMDAPPEVIGEAGDAVDFTVLVRLSTEYVTSPDGVQGWSLGVVAEGGTIVGATVAGTRAALESEGGLRKDDGFEKTEPTTGSGNEGWVSAVVLSSGSNVTLPPNGTETLLQLTVRATVPSPVVSGGQFSCVPLACRVSFRDGLDGSGLVPVQNKVTWQYQAYRPALAPSVTTVCPRISQPHFALSLAAPPSIEGVAGTTERFDSVATLATSDNESDLGAQGWSLAVAATGAVVLSATVDGTAGAPVSAGGFRLEDGFEKTELTSTSGVSGVVSAVVLSSGSDATLPPQGSAALLRVSSEALIPQPIVVAGRLVCSPLEVRLDFQNGLRGTGQPVDNKVSFEGLAVRPSLQNAAITVCPIVDAPEFSLSISAPATIEGAQDAVVEFSGTVRLTVSENPTDSGVQGWSLAIAGTGAEIISATTDGTVGALVVDGGLRLEDGFQKIELASGSGNEGVVAALVLSNGSVAELSTEGSFDLLRLTARAIVPRPIVSAGQFVCRPLDARLGFQNGLRGTGQPVDNKVSFQGLAFRPVLQASSTSVCPQIDAPRFSLSIVAPPSVEGEAQTTVSFPATARLTTSDNTSTEGAQGWSVGFSAGNASIVAVTTAGTAGALASAGPGGFRLADGFEKTELTSGAGNAGAVSAVVLSSGASATLPASGSVDILKLTVEAVVPVPSVSVGELVCNPRVVNLQFRDGLEGSGQPVDTKVTFRGLASRPSFQDFQTQVCPILNAPRFAFRLGAPATLTGAPLSSIEYAAIASIDTSNNSASDGAQGWSLGVKTENCSITDATVAGTAADTVPNGGLRTDGFEQTDLTTGPGNEGATSAVVLGTLEEATLPAAGSANVLRLSVSAVAPAPIATPGGEETCSPLLARLFFADGLVGLGEPVPNKVAYRGISSRPTLGDATTSICPVIAKSFTLRALVLAPTAVETPTGADSADWSISVPLPAGEVEVTMGIELQSRLAEDVLEGSPGWSFAVKTDPSFVLRSVTTAGTGVPNYFSGGFNKTSIVDPALNGGQNGVVSAIVLSFTEVVTLPPRGDELVLRAVGRIDASSLAAPGQALSPSGIRVVPPGESGLVAAASSPPVETKVVLGNKPVAPGVVGARIRIVAKSESLFRRGNANDDSRIDIADAIWIISYKFRQGTAPSCLDAADVNDDGEIDASDVSYLVNYLFGGGIPPTAPFVECGTDADGDTDGLGCNAGQFFCL